MGVSLERIAPYPRAVDKFPPVTFPDKAADRLTPLHSVRHAA
jgi:hypothetical protein